MTVFVCNGNPDKPRESYFVNNPDIITNQTGIDSEKPEARGKGVDNETETSTKPFWVVMISTYLMLLALTIFVIGTIAYGHVLTKTTSDTCSCAENTEEINFRFELLEKKFETLESSFLQIVDSNTRKVVCNKCFRLFENYILISHILISWIYKSLTFYII